MARLETLIQAMESSQLPLDELIGHYEEGVQLVRLCQEKLDAASKKIQIIARSASGPAGLEDFPDAPHET